MQSGTLAKTGKKWFGKLGAWAEKLQKKKIFFSVDNCLAVSRKPL